MYIFVGGRVGLLVEDWGILYVRLNLHTLTAMA